VITAMFVKSELFSWGCDI